MSDRATLEHPLRAVLADLEPYLPEVVLIGGWVPYLYHHYGGFSEWWSGKDTLTRELDILVDRPLSSDGKPPLAELLAGAEFRVDRESTPAVWVRNVKVGEKIELLTAHRGVAHRKGTRYRWTDSPESRRSRFLDWTC